MKKFLYPLLLLLLIAVAGVLFYLKSDAKDPYPETEWGRFSGSCKAEEVPANNYGKDFHSCDYSVPAEEIPVFSKADLNWDNKFDGTKSLPIMGSAMIDIDNDGIDEVF